jgi:DNA replication and repair protein RecF
VLRTPRMSGVLADYDRVLRQRNTLLKSARAVRSPDLTTLDIWDERLVALGSELIEARSALVTDLEPEVAIAYAAIAGADHAAKLHSRLSILAAGAPSGYSADDEVEDESAQRDGVLGADAAADHFRAALVRVRRAELDRGLTLVGPHRDDLVLDLNGLPARGYASHGESWSFALALKLASAQVLRRESQAGDPVLMLDDVFAELDESRRERLADAILGYEQVLITAAVLGDVPERLAGKVLRIRAGTVVDAEE